MSSERYEKASLAWDIVKFVLCAAGGAVILFLVQLVSSALTKEQLKGEIAKNDREAAPVCRLDASIQVVAHPEAPNTTHATHVEIIAEIENIGLADVPLSEISLEVARGIPNAALCDVLCRPLAEVEYDEPSPQPEPAPLGIARIGRIEIVPLPEEDIRVPESEMLIDLNRSPRVKASDPKIDWKKMVDLSRSEYIERTLKPGQKCLVRFRFLLIPHPPECYRFALQASAPDDEWETQSTEVQLPLDFLAQQFTGSGGPVIFELKTGAPQYAR